MSLLMWMLGTELGPPGRAESSLTVEPSLEPHFKSYFKLHLLVCLFRCVCVYVGVCMCVCAATCDMIYMWRSEDNLWELILSFHHVDPEVEVLSGCQDRLQEPLPTESFTPPNTHTSASFKRTSHHYGVQDFVALPALDT